MGFFDKLKKITSNLFSGFTEADEDFFEELEETLIMADLGVDAATDAVEKLRTKVRKEHLQSQEAVREGLREILMAEMEVGDTAMKLDTKPSVCIFIGVNGVGKTTSIGKIAASLKKQGKRVMLCAAEPSAPPPPTSWRSGQSGPDARSSGSTRARTPAPYCSTHFRLLRPGTWMWCCATPPDGSTTRQI